LFILFYLYFFGSFKVIERGGFASEGKVEDHLHPLSVSYSFVFVGRGPYFEEIIQSAFNRGKGEKKKKRKKKGRCI